MNMLILGVALTGAALLPPSAKANEIGDPAGLYQGASAFSLAAVDATIYLAALSPDTQSYLDSELAQIAAAIDRAALKVEPPTGGPETFDADASSAVEFPIYSDTYGHASNHDAWLWTADDAPAYAPEYWLTTAREIPVAQWEPAVYEIPLTIELVLDAVHYAPAGFITDPMAVELASSDSYAPIESILMMEVRVLF